MQGEKEGSQVNKILVVGARPRSIGSAIAKVAESKEYKVVLAGIHNEDVKMDVVADAIGSLREKLVRINPDHIICTVGMNMPESAMADDPADWYRWHFETNVTGPMRLLQAWTDVNKDRSMLKHYVAISSNSARVPRTASAAYCASKAALSQALRVKAREGEGGDKWGVVVYGYEPALIAATPMTEEAAHKWGADNLTRMRGSGLARGIWVGSFAQYVVHGLHLGPAMNGMLVPFDGDER